MPWWNLLRWCCCSCLGCATEPLLLYTDTLAVRTLWWRCCLIDRACWMRNSRPVWGLDFATNLFCITWFWCWMSFREFNWPTNKVSAGLVLGGFATWISQWTANFGKPESKKKTNPTHNQGVWFYLALVAVIKPRGVISDSILLNPPLIVETTILTQDFVVIKFVTLMLGFPKCKPMIS